MLAPLGEYVSAAVSTSGRSAETHNRENQHQSTQAGALRAPKALHDCEDELIDLYREQQLLLHVVGRARLRRQQEDIRFASRRLQWATDAVSSCLQERLCHDATMWTPSRRDTQDPAEAATRLHTATRASKELHITLEQEAVIHDQQVRIKQAELAAAAEDLSAAERALKAQALAAETARLVATEERARQHQLEIQALQSEAQSLREQHRVQVRVQAATSVYYENLQEKIGNAATVIVGQLEAEAAALQQEVLELNLGRNRRLRQMQVVEQQAEEERRLRRVREVAAIAVHVKLLHAARTIQRAWRTLMEKRKQRQKTGKKKKRKGNKKGSPKKDAKASKTKGKTASKK